MSNRRLRTSSRTHLADLWLAAIGAVLWLVVVALAASMWLKPWPDILFRTDFAAFWTGASLVREGVGSTLFDLRAQQAFQAGLQHDLTGVGKVVPSLGFMPFYNPPPLALPLLPLTLLPLPWGYIVWWVFGLVTFGVAVALPLRGAALGSTRAMVLLTFVGVASTLLEGQVNGLFVLALSLALLALASGRPTLGGSLLGLLWLKPQYCVVFALVLLAKKRWRELAGMLATAGLLAVLSLAMVGQRGIGSYLGVLSQVGQLRPAPEMAVSTQTMVNWRALLLAVWPDVPDATGTVLVLALGAATALASLLAWSGKWDPASARFPRQMLVAAMATVVASPHSHFHGTVILLAPLAMALARPTDWAPLARLWKPALLLGYLLSLVLWPFRTLFWVLVPYAVALMGLLVLQCRRQRMGDG